MFVVAVPIGNVDDISERAKQVLARADIVAAEDTRSTQKLLAILGIRAKTISNHKFNERSQVDFLVSGLESGKNIALVSDAGTPCVSDPGAIVVKAAAERGITVAGVPGASSVITALSVSGFAFDSFAFYGFFPRGEKEIRAALKSAEKTGAAVFFESPLRIKKTLEVIVNAAPSSALCLCNDLTKLFERIYRGSPESVLNELLDNPAAEKGEYTLVYAPAKDQNETEKPAALSPEALLVDCIIKNDCTIKDAVKTLAETKAENYTKKDFYNASLRLKETFGAMFSRGGAL